MVWHSHLFSGIFCGPLPNNENTRNHAMISLAALRKVVLVRSIHSLEPDRRTASKGTARTQRIFIAARNSQANAPTRK